MKSISFIYSSDRRFEELIQANELDADKSYLIRIHTCVHNCNTIMPFVDKILSYLPCSHIIGSSTSGVILNGEILTDCCMVSVTDLGSASVRTFIKDIPSLNNENTISGAELADSVCYNVGNSASDIMLSFFAQPFAGIGEFVERINTNIPDMQVIGGVANTPDIQVLNTTRQHSFVFTEKSASLSAVACAVIGSEKMSVYSDIIYVTEPVGKSHTITEADGMIIRSVDGQNAVDWYQEMLGVNFDEMSDSADITVTFPIVKENQNNIPWAIAYSPQTPADSVFADEPEPVMFVPSEAKAGDKIRISYSSIQTTMEVCKNVCLNISAHPSEVLFGYSCVSRQNMFSNCAKWELLPFVKTNMSGALVAGEIGNINNVNLYCNYSFAIASLSESNNSVKLDIDALDDNANTLVNNQLNIIEYLLRNNNSDQTPDMVRQQKEIKSSLFIDEDTGLGNVTKYMFDYNVGKFDKICMITIRNEGLLKAFMSESKFLIYFNRFHKSIMEFIGDERYRCYIYKKTALIITAHSEIACDDFIVMLTKLQNYVSDYKFSSYVPVSEFSVVMNETEMIKKAELALNRMRAKKHCFLTYTAELGLEQFNAQKMKMIRILNDAISNNRVVPYFQGIHDNKSKNIRMYEALMRIEDSDGNTYLPYQFMDIAKEYGYYADISYIMINRVLELFRDCTDKVTVNMNISDLYNYRIIHTVLTFLENAPHPENYIFELTETEEIIDYQVIFEFVQKIHEAGGSIAIDDFGSGFSNIVNVFKINSDYIKIDGEIIKNIGSDVYALEFLEMISQWAEKHGKEIIAEFVENQSIQQIIEHNNIRFSQGYLYAKPVKLLA